MQAAWDKLIQWQESLNEDERLLAMLRDMSANIMEVYVVVHCFGESTSGMRGRQYNV